MKILFITSFSPYNLSSGGNQRSYLVCKSLCDLGSVDVVCFSHKEEVGNMTLLPMANYLKTVIEKRPNLIHKSWHGDSRFEYYCDQFVAVSQSCRPRYWFGCQFFAL